MAAIRSVAAGGGFCGCRSSTLRVAFVRLLLPMLLVAFVVDPSDSVLSVLFGATGVKPIPVIILAQAFNGLVLPLIAVFLWLTMNDLALLGKDGVNTKVQNLVMGAVVLVCVALGLRGLIAAAAGALAYVG